MDASIFFRAAQLRVSSEQLTLRWRLASEAWHAQTDAAVLICAQTRRMREEASRLEQWRQLSEVGIYRHFAFFGKLVDVEICEDLGLLAELNSEGCDCDRCERGEAIAAVIRFLDLSSVITVCALCFQELSNLSLGQVT